MARAGVNAGAGAAAAGLLVWFVVVGPSPAHADDDPWLGVDKAKHFGVSVGLGVAAYGGLWLLGSRDGAPLRLSLAIGLALMPGLAKEVYDAGQPHGRFSGKDMLANALGAAVGALLVYGIERLIGARARPRSTIGGAAWHVAAWRAAAWRRSLTPAPP